LTLFWIRYTAFMRDDMAIDPALSIVLKRIKIIQ